MLVKFKDCEAVLAGEAESVTATVKLNVPELLGSPLMVPVLLSRAKPGGNCPDAIAQA